MGYGIVNVGYPPRLNQPGGVAGVGDDGKIPESVLPFVGGYFIIPAGSTLPPAQRQPNALYGQIIDDFTGTPAVLGGGN